ncbi:MAG: hypothetical protein JHC95_12580 [Solirubrobacteraceae bacterium]|nr:hypothetical protein [Solirubrobacteraceae bacterium]
MGNLIPILGVAEFELDAVTTGISDQVQEALTVALPVAGSLLALMVGWRLVRRLVKA